MDSGSTFSFATPLVAMKFEILTDILDEPFVVSTPSSDFVVVNRAYKGCPISLPNRGTLANLIELYMLDFDVI